MRHVKPGPIHRSLTFWSGILMMAFICWAWRDSSQVHSIASASGWTLRQAGSAVSIHRARGVANNAPWAGRFPVDPASSPWEGAYLAEPMFVRSTEDREGRTRFFAASGPHSFVPRRPEAVHLYDIYIVGSGGWTLLLPHWLILISIALPWSGLLLWRARRGPGGW